MSETPMRLIVDLSKPTGDPDRERYVPLTEEEIAANAELAAAEEERQAALEAEAAAKAAAKEAATAKLAALGLTEEEIAAITA